MHQTWNMQRLRLQHGDFLLCKLQISVKLEHISWSLLLSLVKQINTVRSAPRPHLFTAIHLVVTVLMFLSFLSTTDSNKKPQTLFIPQQTFWSKNTTTERFIKKVYCHISNPNIKVPVNCRTNSDSKTDEHRANRSQTQTDTLIQDTGETVASLTHVTDPQLTWTRLRFKLFQEQLGVASI